MQTKVTHNNIDMLITEPVHYDQIFIMCHGFGSAMDSRSLRLIGHKLLDNNIASVSFDMPGHGESTEKLTLAGCLAKLGKVEQYIHSTYPDKKVSLFGVSFGGYVIFNYLMNNKNNYSNIIFRAPAVNMRAIIPGQLSLEEKARLKKFGSIPLSFNDRVIITQQFCDELSQIDLLQKRFDRTMYIFQGEDDDTALPKDVKKFVANNKNANLIMLEGISHNMSN